ncbi:hypothetical protein CHS0354_017999 [Potamilus streckersoni]|uniref:Uncharacterized protein n=1 Tax=Potamilus streckersoni TaxID=2493646 RepID=A0AAE0VJI7_9BIVA|nr:hypothetical protein CHS0354_017999 [Potamilus streckersoni]
MYITVKFGVDIELSDETGNIKHLREALNKYANEILEEREILVLLRVEKSSKENPGVVYVPLLNAITEDFMAQLSVGCDRRGSRPNSQRAQSNTRRNKNDGREKSDGSRKSAKASKRPKSHHHRN